MGRGGGRGGEKAAGRREAGTPSAAPGTPPNRNAWLLHPALPLDVRLLGLGVGAVVVGAWVTGGEAPLKSLWGSNGGADAGEGGSGVGTEAGTGVPARGAEEEAPAGGLDLDQVEAAQAAAAGGQGEGGRLEDSAPSLHLEVHGEAESPAPGPVEEAHLEEEQAVPSSEPSEAEKEAQPAEDEDLLPAMGDGESSDNGKPLVPEGGAAGEEDPTVITEDDMKSISDLLAEAVGVGAPLTADGVEFTDVNSPPIEAVEADGGAEGPGEIGGLTEEVAEEVEDAAPRPNTSAVESPSPVKKDQDPEPHPATSEEVPFSTAEASLESRSTTSALPQRAVKAVLEAASPAALVGRALKEGEEDLGEQWELYGAMHRQAATDAEFVAEALKLVQNAYEVSCLPPLLPTTALPPSRPPPPPPLCPETHSLSFCLLH